MTRLAAASRLIAAVSAASALVWICLLILPGHVLPLSLLKFVLFVNILHLIGQTIASAVSLRLGAQFAAAAVLMQIAVVMAMFLLAADTPVSVLRCCSLATPSLVVSGCAWIVNERQSASRQSPSGGQAD